MKKHFNKRLLALILSAILLICACPLSVFASELNGMNTAAMPGSGGDGPPSDSTEMSDIDLGFDLDIDENFDTGISAELTEDIKLRDTFTKHYTDGNGKYYAVVFPEQVHYLENGEWKEIDNSLTLNKQGNAYISGNKSFKTGFSKSSSSAELVTIEEGMYKLSWGILFDAGSELKDVISSSDIAMNETGSMTPVNARLTENRSDALNEKGTAAGITKENIGDLGKAFSGISYDGILGDKVDLRYSVLHGKVKEDVILNSASDFRSYTLTVNTYGLNATKLPDNRVSFKNSDGETIFTIGTPWMKDSDASVSDNIAVTVIQNGTTAYIKYEPDREWLNDAERVYPVLIDPDVTTRTFKSNYIDTYVYEGDSASSARANETTMIVGNKNNKKYYSYIKFLDVPDLSSYYYYTSKVTLTFWAETTSSPSLSVYQVNASWNPNTITYASQPSSSLIISEQLGRAIGSRSRYAIDMTNFVNGWLYNEDDNYYSNPTEFFTSSDWNGFKIGYTSDLPGNFTQIYSSEFTYSGLRPTLTFEYEYINPSCINDGAIYSFINSASGKYLTVDNGNINAGTNIYQYTKNNSRSQAFRIEKDSYYDYLRIVSMCNDDGDPQSVLSFCYDATITESGYTYQNATLEDNDDDAEYNDLIWYIIPHNGSDSLFKIVSGADPNLALTSYGTANGTASGTTNTSAGNVFVSRFTGASNQLWTLESGENQIKDVVDIVEVSENNETYTISVGSSWLIFCCPVQNFGDYISWASSNQSVAEIDSDGKVTAKKAGYTTISAYGNEEEYSCTVYVRLADGTYYINNQYSDFRIEYENKTSLSENSALIGKDSGTTEPTDRSQMFKIKYLGNGCYSVRSMLDNSMGWTNVSNKLVMTTIGTSDSAVPANAKWILDTSIRGYRFKSSSGNMAITLPTTSGGNITITNHSAGASAQTLTIKPITASYHGVTIKNKTSRLDVGKSFSFSAVIYSTSSSNYDSSRVTWSVTNKMGRATINSSTGALTGVSQGSVIVTATFRYSYATEYTASQKVIIDGSAPINDGSVYFVINKSKPSFYLKKNNNDNNNCFLDAQQFSNKAYPKWIFLKDSDGYFSIRLADDYDKYITVPSGSETSVGSEFTFESANASSRQKWRITKLSNGAFTISAKSSESYSNGDLVISLPLSGTKLQQREYTNNTDYRDEWIFVPYSIMFYGIPAGEGHDHVTSISGAKSKLET